LNQIYGQTPTASILKSSGTRTPAPTSKVLRWKDLEAAPMQSAAGGEQEEAMSAKSVIEVGAGGERIINVEESWNQEYTEDLSV
jgi:hypothetical protein